MVEDEQPDGGDGAGDASRTGSQGTGDQSDSDESGEGTRTGWLDSIRTRIGRASRRQKIVRGSTLFAVFGLVVLVAIVPTGLLALPVNDEATFTAAPAAPDSATVTEAGYELQSADEVTVEQEISPAGQDRTIVVNNQRRTYERAVAVQNRSYNTGVFVTLSTPAIRVAGSSQNPVADMSDRELLQRFGGQLTNGSEELDFERVGTRDAAMLGTSTDVGEFRTTVSVGGEPQAVAVYVTRVRSEDDIVVAVGVHPTAFPGDRVSLFQLIYAVEHPSE